MHPRLIALNMPYIRPDAVFCAGDRLECALHSVTLLFSQNFDLQDIEGFICIVMNLW
jgi:hypothetical protein